MLIATKKIVLVAKRLIDVEAKSRERNSGAAGNSEFHATGAVAKLAAPN